MTKKEKDKIADYIFKKRKQNIYDYNEEKILGAFYHRLKIANQVSVDSCKRSLNMNDKLLIAYNYASMSHVFQKKLDQSNNKYDTVIGTQKKFTYNIFNIIAPLMIAKKKDKLSICKIFDKILKLSENITDKDYFNNYVDKWLSDKGEDLKIFYNVFTTRKGLSELKRYFK